MNEDVSRRSGAPKVTVNLLEVLRVLATSRHHAEVYQTPEGEYRLTGPDCLTGSAANRYIAARFQLIDVMDAAGVPLDEFVRDRDAAERVATALLDDRWRRDVARAAGSGQAS
jgi:hypothetical protein